MAHFKVNGSKRKRQGKASKNKVQGNFPCQEIFLLLEAALPPFSLSGGCDFPSFSFPHLFFFALWGWLANENKQKSKLQIRRNYKVS